MESRSTILIVLFFLLIGTAGYYYWGPITKYAQEQKILDRYPTVRNTINYGLNMAGLPPIKKSINGSNVRTESITKYRGAVVNSLPVSSINWVRLFRSNGVRTQVNFSLRSETQDQTEPTPLEGTLDLASYKSGSATAALTLEQADRHQFRQATLQSVDNTIHVSIPELGLRLRTPSFVSSTVGSIGWGLNRYMSANVNKTETTNWRGHEVHQINLQSSDGNILRLYVTREKPRYLVGAQAIVGENNWERQYVYANDAATVLSEIRTFRNEDRVSTVTVRQTGGRNELEFSNPNSTYLSTVRLQFVEGSGENLSADVVLESSVFDGSLELGRLDVEMAEGLPASFQFELAYEGSESFPVRLSGNLGANSLNWVRGTPDIAVDESGDSTSSPMQLVRKVIRGNALELAERQGTRDTDPAETDSSTKPQVEAETEPAEETDGSGEDTSTQPGARSESAASRTAETTPDETAGESDRKAESRTAGRQRSGDGIPYPELQRAPRESGETIHRSHGYNFPYTEPPKSYQSAQQDYYDGNFKQARNKLKKLLKRYPKSVNVNYLLGVIHYQLGNAEEARRYFEAVFELRHDPQLRAWSQHYLAQLGDTAAVPKN